MAAVAQRNYALEGPETERAIAKGLADAVWYQSPVDPALMKQLQVRSNARGLRDLALWLGLLVLSGVAAFVLFPSWWCIIPFAFYSTFYGSSADPRWHECGHGTAFKTGWINTAVYYLASFMLLREPTVWRWSHVRHHSDTIVVGRDPEIILPRPPPLWKWTLNLFNIDNGPRVLARMVRHSFGKISIADRSYIPASEQRRVVTEARIFVALHVAVVVWAVAAWSLLPLLFVTLPSFYGAWLMLAFGTTQHLGLREDVLDHRRNTRTIYFNPVLRFLYLNMNYHVEHHMFPTVPYHQLPRLHEAIKDDLPETSPSFSAAFREAMTALRAQRSDPDHQIANRMVPEGAGSAAVEVAVTVTGVGAGAWIDAGPDDSLAPESVVRVDVGDDTYALYRLEDGSYRATDGICTHSRRTHLAGGLVIDGQIECPKHNGRFDIVTGECTRAPVEKPLPVHEVDLRDGRIMIRR